MHVSLFIHFRIYSNMLNESYRECKDRLSTITIMAYKCTNIRANITNLPSCLGQQFVHSHDTKLLQQKSSLRLTGLYACMHILHCHSSTHLVSLLLLNHTCISQYHHNLIMGLIPKNSDSYFGVNYFSLKCQIHFVVFWGVEIERKIEETGREQHEV